MKFRRNQIVAVLIVVIALISSVIAFYVYYQTRNSSTSSGDCTSIRQTASGFFQGGFTYVCGNDSVSDGRLAITIHSYKFLAAKDIQFHFAPNENPVEPDEVFLLVNVTVRNIGGGNASIGPSFNVAVLNGTSYVDATQFIANASFPNSYPNEVIPDVEYHCGCLYIPPGANTSLWLFFTIPFIPASPNNINKTSNLAVQLLAYREFSYGGTYDGYGSFSCQKIPCLTTNTEFLIRYQNS